MARPLARMMTALLLTAGVWAAGPPEPVRTTAGPITGTDDGGTRAYLGIPYAAPPVGELRWRPPQPPVAWSEPRAMDRFGPACPQHPSELNREIREMSEDCLSLNVWTPADSENARLPVMFWIHGGGFVHGAGGTRTYNGARLAAGGAVVVTINYRLGPLGFLAHPALSAESDRGTSGNWGLMDQIAALEWVRDNIARFGGDPGCVTVFGESAGAVSVCTLMATPRATGLFHRAIVQSGTPPATLRPLRGGGGRRGDAETAGKEFAAKLGVADGPEALAKLRALSWQEVLAGTEAGVELPGSTLGQWVCLDGWVLTEQPAATFAEGRQAPVPLIAGANRDEGTLWARTLRSVTASRYQVLLRGMFGRRADEALALYPGGSDEEAFESAVRLLGESFHQGARSAVRGGAQVQPETRLYYFTRASGRAVDMGLGCHHGAEIPFVFGNLAAGQAGNPTDEALSEAMMAYWLRFARTGDPNGEGAPSWPAWTADGEAYLELGAEIRVGTHLKQSELDLLEGARDRLGGMVGM